ncbi:hypothetical protein CANARDRAFT_201609 [[Candida] arabinofermentans NRRL YB-2248]|uniref:Major facilitator superfamily (MFS) profile domain-containing protein n=1 Tax=[Candida] arabinofermentans NRRL YB-2248 TaxID=983967 RepID=A0A1E4SXK8_9ASCO|nr:hypothetical protein CANARDRAFT_201609 [[Candida] arabinofermentans NRRL YB-2248]
MESKVASGSSIESTEQFDFDQSKGFLKFNGCHNTFGLKGTKLRTAITTTCILGFFLFGYDQGLMSGIITSDQFIAVIPAVSGGTRHATVVQGAVVSSYELGCFFGAIFVLLRGESIGRRRLMIAGASIMILGTIISVLPFRGHWAIGHFVVGRVITGVGNGLNTATIPVWQSELSKSENRGRLINLEGSSVAFGTLLAYWIDFGLSYVNNSVAWRLPIAFQAIFAFCIFFGALNLPESPRWLIARGRVAEARYILGKLDDLPPDDDAVIAEATVISDAVNRTEGAEMGLVDIFKSDKLMTRTRMLLGASGQLFQQFTGCNAAIYYSTVLFQNSIGLARRLSLILGGVFAVVYFLSSIIPFFLVDRLGRRPLYLIGTAGQAVAFVISMGCLIADTKSASKGAAFGIFLFIFFFAVGQLPLPWLYPAEVNSLKSRTLSVSISTCTNWISNFTVVMFTPIFISQSGWGCYLFFAAMNLCFLPVIYFFYPETAGRTLEEIDIIFAKAYDEGTLPYKIAQTMPKLTLQQIEEEGNRLGIWDDDFLKGNSDELIEDVKSSPEEKV